MNARQSNDLPSPHDSISDSPQSQPGIWIIDGNGNTKFVSERMAEILGESRKSLAGKSSFEYVFPEDMNAAKRLFEAKRGGDHGAFRFRLRRSNGDPVWVDVQGTPLFEEGQVTGIVGTFLVIQNGA
jgi:PAS domain S-box-containing protein